MTTKNVARALAVVAVMAWAATTQAIEMHGYFRDTIGTNSKGGGIVCYQLPGSNFKARLGNECDRYLEMTFSETGKIDNVDWRVEFMPAQFQPIDGAAPGNSLFVQQMWSGLKFNDWDGVTIWAGRRYFKRHDVHSIDWFYWNPAQGNGAVGIEDIKLGGFGKLAFTLIRMEATNGNALSQGVYMVPDFRLYDANINPGGTLEVGLDLALANDQKVTGVDGLGADRSAVSPLITVQHNQNNILGGSNTLAVQYGSGAFAKESGDGPGQLLAGGSSKDKQWRIIEHLVINPTKEISSAFVVVYQDISAPASTGAKIFSLEVRPSYQFTDHFKLSLDGFFQQIADKTSRANGGFGTANLTKLTVAPTLVLGHGYYARPELRLFATYGSWNNDAAALGTIANGAFGTSKNGTSVGWQLEIWF